MAKIKVGILFGGSSVEHEVSVLSARNIFKYIDKAKYDIHLIAVDKQGEMRLMNDVPQDTLSIKHEPNHPDRLAVIPSLKQGKFIHKGREFSLDVIFTVCHGFIGEDGHHQGLFRCLNIPLAGSEVLGGAVGIDKYAGKRLLRDANIPIADFLVYNYHERERISYSEVTKRLGDDIFIKPVSQGSSIGISHVTEEKDFAAAIENAFAYDEKIMIERKIFGREIEFAVIGNTNLQISGAGEVVPKGNFYSYESKYFDPNGAEFVTNPELPAGALEKLQEMAKRAYAATECKDYARVDMFLGEDGQCFVNEVNTLPGFTNMSMFPMLLLASGMSYPEMIDRILELTLQRAAEKDRIRTSFDRLAGE